MLISDWSSDVCSSDLTDEAVRHLDTIGLTDRSSQLVALRVAASLDKIGEGEAARRLRARIALAAGEREDPLLLLPDQPVSTPRAGVAHWLGLLADGIARTPNGKLRRATCRERVCQYV